MNKRGEGRGGCRDHQISTPYLCSSKYILPCESFEEVSRVISRWQESVWPTGRLVEEGRYRFHKDEWHSNYVARVDETAPRITKIDDPANRIFEVDIGDSRIGMCWLLGFERGGNIGISELQL